MAQPLSNKTIFHFIAVGESSSCSSMDSGKKERKKWKKRKKKAATTKSAVKETPTRALFFPLFFAFINGRNYVDPL